MKRLGELFRRLAVGSRLMIDSNEVKKGWQFYDVDGREITDTVAELARLNQELSDLKHEFTTYRYLVKTRVTGWDDVNLMTNLGRRYEDVYTQGIK